MSFWEANNLFSGPKIFPILWNMTINYSSHKTALLVFQPKNSKHWCTVSSSLKTSFIVYSAHFSLKTYLLYAVMIQRLVILRKNNIYLLNSIKGLVFAIGRNFAFFGLFATFDYYSDKFKI